MNNASVYRPSAAPYYTPSASPSYRPSMSGSPSVMHHSHPTASMSGYAPSGYMPARPAMYPTLPPTQTFRTTVRPGTPVTASQALEANREAARKASRSTTASGNRLKSLVAFFVFWVVVSSLFLFLYVDRMI